MDHDAKQQEQRFGRDEIFIGLVWVERGEGSFHVGRGSFISIQASARFLIQYDARRMNGGTISHPKDAIWMNRGTLFIQGAGLVAGARSHAGSEAGAMQEGHGSK